MPKKDQITPEQRAAARRDETAVQLCEALIEGKEDTAGRLLSRYAAAREELEAVLAAA